MCMWFYVCVYNDPNCRKIRTTGTWYDVFSDCRKYFVCLKNVAFLMQWNDWIILTMIRCIKYKMIYAGDFKNQTCRV